MPTKKPVIVSCRCKLRETMTTGVYVINNSGCTQHLSPDIVRRKTISDMWITLNSHYQLDIILRVLEEATDLEAKEELRRINIILGGTKE